MLLMSELKRKQSSKLAQNLLPVLVVYPMAPQFNSLAMPEQLMMSVLR